MEVPFRQQQHVGERAIAIDDAERRPLRTVRRQASAARRARAAVAVDLPDDAAAGQRAGHGDADELVAEHTAKSHVAADQLQVGGANAGRQYPHQHLAVMRHRFRIIRTHAHAIIEDEGSHGR